MNPLIRILQLISPFLFLFHPVQAQESKPLFSDSGWTAHAQFTGIIQGHPAFMAPYSGKNSLGPASERAYSTTVTLYVARKLWRGASIYFNPEMAGGKGISSTLGIAGFPNGETFRIGDPEPTVYVARIFLRQHISLSHDEGEISEDGPNSFNERLPSSRITLNFGKFCLADFFDGNSVSHDPRKDFMNWSLMNNGAYDYAANTRGYTIGFVAEYVRPGWALRFGTALEPTYANGPELDEHYLKSNSETLELEKEIHLGKRPGVVRLLAYYNVTKAPNYREVIAANEDGTDTTLDVINGKKYGGKKFGLGLNIEQELSDAITGFARIGWNDGKTASWAFAEIDNTFAAGINISGKGWKRAADKIGIALLSNGLSGGHRDFLKVGGYGFMIGDGQLPNYTRENALEIFYSLNIFRQVWATLDYQFIGHPAYNLDRGPVSVFAARVHFEL